MSLGDCRVLVTGADGFIGSHLAEELTRRGVKVRALVMYNSFGRSGWLDSSPPELAGSMEILAGDIRDPHAMVELTAGIDVVFHLASLVAIPFSYLSPDNYVKTNVIGTLNMLQAARTNGVKKFVHTSTSEIYGSAGHVPMDESHPQNAHSPYAATKIAADQLALSYLRSFSLPVTVVRPFNTYGPRQSARAIIPTIISQIASGAASIRLGNLDPTRDFTYVSDVVVGFIAAAERPDLEGEVIHLGSGSEISIGELVSRIAALMKSEVEIVSDARRMRPQSSEVDRLVCDNSKAARLLEWSPKVEFEKGLRRTIQWVQDNLDHPGYRPDRYVI
ncbi:MAG: SDR family NAD(P)-dependent oxidoreductase [Candidatus Zixiibacteriota bacterium]|nr:MAG: SDR family NAD(P)-dependent oxidoreductase [candidate division Zixibacteria bacterium]